MLVIGLTGGIATGKSTVSSLLASHGIPIIDADVLARQVVLPGSRALRLIASEFGREVLKDDGTLDRAKLGTVIFNDDAKRKKLNSIVHPAVQRAMAWGVLKCWLGGEKLCVLDVPLLVETGMWKWMGKVIVVYCSRDVQLMRLMKRDGSTSEEASSRLNAQLAIEKKVDYADHVVDNSGSLREVEGHVASLVKRVAGEVRWWWVVDWLLPPVGLFSAVNTLVWRTRKRTRGSSRSRASSASSR